MIGEDKLNKELRDSKSEWLISLQVSSGRSDKIFISRSDEKRLPIASFMTRTRYFPKLEIFSSAVISLHQLNPDTAISLLIDINMTLIFLEIIILASNFIVRGCTNCILNAQTNRHRSYEKISPTWKLPSSMRTPHHDDPTRWHLSQAAVKRAYRAVPNIL